MRFAQIAVNIGAPLEGTFHYHLPPDLEDVVEPGHLVEVEFGSRMVQGMVVRLDDRSPVPETKPVIALVIPDRVLSDAQLALARWMSETYLTPLMDCLRLMLPPGISQRADVTLELIEGVEEGKRLTDAQQALVSLLQEKGDLRGRQISQVISKLEWQPAAEQLVKRNILRRGSVLDPPRVNPKVVRTARLVAGQDQIAVVLRTLGRRSIAAEVLEWLADSDDPLPTAERVREATGCTKAHLRKLAERNAVVINPARILLSMTAGATDVRLPEENKWVGFLREASVPVLLTPQYLVDPITGSGMGYELAVLDGLIERGVVARTEEPSTVALAISLKEVREVAAEFRGARVYQKVLDFLAGEPEAVDVSWIYAETGCKLYHLKVLADADLIVFGEEEVWRDPLANREFVPDEPPLLTDDQASAWGHIKRALLERRPGQGAGLSPANFLLHGVTGSGKTEIYMRAIDLAVKRGQGAIVLVPEISLTAQTIRRFAARFPGRVALVHSRLNDGERYDTWRRVRQGMVDIVIGPRSALFAPFDNLGVVVIDEEHDEAYKQDPPVRAPYYHARNVAIKLVSLTGAVLIMGSATPDLVTYHRARRGELFLLELPLRIMGHRRRVQSLIERVAPSYSPDGIARDTRYKILDESAGLPDAMTIDLPPVDIVDMRQELRAGNRSIFSRALTQALEETLERDEQAILFLNRRGTASFVFCRDCGLVLKCPRCELPLTYHRSSLQLICHHCGRMERQPERCPRCQSHRIKYFGLGTEGVETEVLNRFPGARVLRWDRDTTAGKDAHELFLQQFIRGRADVLVGTQMIAKGLDLPLVTLVGVIAADVSLGLPDYRTGERTFQVLAQVAGRAGRGILGGRVLLQTFNPDHYAIRAAAEHDFVGFYIKEIAFRARLGYPPYKRLARLEYRDPIIDRGRRMAEGQVKLLRKRAKEERLDATEILGPTQPFFSRLEGRYRWQIVIRAPDPVDLLKGYSPPAGWLVDMDPMSLL